ARTSRSGGSGCPAPSGSRACSPTPPGAGRRSPRSWTPARGCSRRGTRRRPARQQRILRDLHAACVDENLTSPASLDVVTRAICHELPAGRDEDLPAGVHLEAATGPRTRGVELPADGRVTAGDDEDEIATGAERAVSLQQHLAGDQHILI